MGGDDHLHPHDHVHPHESHEWPESPESPESPDGTDEPPELDPSIPDEELPPGLVSRRSLFRAARLLGAGAAVGNVLGAPGTALARGGTGTTGDDGPGRETRGGYVWMAGDHHIHIPAGLAQSAHEAAASHAAGVGGRAVVYPGVGELTGVLTVTTLLDRSAIERVVALDRQDDPCSDTLLRHPAPTP
jgi:hypothetical protein